MKLDAYQIPNYTGRFYINFPAVHLLRTLFFWVSACIKV